MATARPPGPLGTDTNPGELHSGLSSLASHAASFAVDAAHHAEEALADGVAHAVHEVRRAWSELSMRSAICQLLGTEAFALGVVTGMGRHAVADTRELVELVRIFALADYWEMRYSPHFLDRLRSTFGLHWSPGTLLAAGAAMLGPHTRALDEAAARQAYDDREALFAGVRYAVGHPQAVFETLTQALQARYETFRQVARERALSNNYQAGVLFGDLLFDVLMAIDLVTGLGKLLLAVPRLARIEKTLARLADVAKQSARRPEAPARTAPEAPRQAVSKEVPAQGHKPRPETGNDPEAVRGATKQAARPLEHRYNRGGLAKPGNTAGQATDDVAGLFRRTENIGDFADLKVPMQMRYVEQAAEDGGVGLQGVKVRIVRDPDLLGKNLYGYTAVSNLKRNAPTGFEFNGLSLDSIRTSIA